MKVLNTIIKTLFFHRYPLFSTLYRKFFHNLVYSHKYLRWMKFHFRNEISYLPGFLTKYTHYIIYVQKNKRIFLFSTVWEYGSTWEIFLASCPSEISMFLMSQIVQFKEICERLNLLISQGLWRVRNDRSIILWYMYITRL